MSYFAHETAIVEEGAQIGEGTRIWHHAHVRSGCEIGENCNIGKNCYIDEGAKIGNGVKIQNNVSALALDLPKYNHGLLLPLVSLPEYRLIPRCSDPCGILPALRPTWHRAYGDILHWIEFQFYRIYLRIQ